MSTVPVLSPGALKPIPIIPPASAAAATHPSLSMFISNSPSKTVPDQKVWFALALLVETKIHTDQAKLCLEAQSRAVGEMQPELAGLCVVIHGAISAPCSAIV